MIATDKTSRKARGRNKSNFPTDPFPGYAIPLRRQWNVRIRKELGRRRLPKKKIADMFVPTDLVGH